MEKKQGLAWFRILRSSIAGLLDRFGGLLGVIHSLWWILLVGLLVRIVLIPISQDPDLVGFAQTSASEVYGQGPYAYSSIYPPFWSFYLNIVGHIVATLVPGPQWITTGPENRALWAVSSGLASPYVVDLAYTIVEKVSLLPFDVGSGLVLYYLAVRLTGNLRSGRFAFAFWFLNPIVIVVSAIHGTFDVIPTLCVLAGFILVFEKRYATSGVAIATGTLFKIFPILFAPLLLVMAWKDSRSASHAPYRAPGLLLAGLLTVPAITFLAPGLLSQFLQYSTIGVRTGQEVYGGFGFWGVFSIPGLSEVGAALSGSSYGFLALLLLSILVASLVSVRFMLGAASTSISDPAWVYGALLIAIAAYLLPMVDQPQYTVWALPFVLLLGLRDRFFKQAYVLLSALPTLFYVVLLGGPLFFFLPLWYHFHLIDFAACYDSVAYWLGPGHIFLPLATVPFSIMLAGCVFFAGRELFERKGGQTGGTAPPTQ